jgi:hypothetical protein
MRQGKGPERRREERKSLEKERRCGQKYFWHKPF